MANEFRKVTDLNGVNHPVCDDTRVDWASYAVLGAINLFDISKVVNANLKVENNTLENAVTDTRSANFWVGIRKGTTPVQTLLTLQYLPSVGHYEFSFTIPNNVDYDNLYIGHNGANTDVKCSYPFNRFGTFYISFDATGVDVSTVGGYVLTNVQIALSADAPYASPTMTNKELTEKINTYMSGSGTWYAGDLNDLPNGVTAIGSSATNKPFSWGIIITMYEKGVTAASGVQIGVSITSDILCVRHKNDGTWSAWKQATLSAMS